MLPESLYRAAGEDNDPLLPTDHRYRTGDPRQWWSQAGYLFGAPNFPPDDPRRILALPDISTGSISLLGIDDFAFWHGYRFGAILVNLESHVVADLLPARQAKTSADWMRQYPDITVVIVIVAANIPKQLLLIHQAIQYVDRFHVVKKVTEATQFLLICCLAEIMAESNTAEMPLTRKNLRSPSKNGRPLEPAYVEKTRLGGPACYQQVIALHEQGMKPKEITRRLDLLD